MNRPRTRNPNANSSGDLVGWKGFPNSDVAVGSTEPDVAGIGVALPNWPPAMLFCIYAAGKTGGT